MTDSLRALDEVIARIEKRKTEIKNLGPDNGWSFAAVNQLLNAIDEVLSEVMTVRNEEEQK